VCEGEPAQERFSLRTGHGRAAGGRFRTYPLDEVGRALPGGGRVKEAHTDFTLLRRMPGAALLLAEPRTGRSHQIRLHAAALGHPLLGDERYGGPTRYAGRALPFHLLHALRLRLPHPNLGEPLTVEAPLPEHFSAVSDR
jgi:23S rRNA pseudouridine1911/1915/1917 synthase